MTPMETGDPFTMPIVDTCHLVTKAACWTHEVAGTIGQHHELREFLIRGARGLTDLVTGRRHRSLHRVRLADAITPC